MTIVELIERKRDGGTFTAAEIHWLITAYTADEIPDYQMASMLMAVFLRGLNDRELAAWTTDMMHSGEVLDLSAIAKRKIDKHSTGGVGDKVSIPLAPMVAACGIAVPMISGRGLGHTGGTLDKMETIPGLRTALDPAEFKEILGNVGMVMAGQSESIVPADRRMYALRDVTATVPSIDLISASIMSKKLAEDLDGLVLDVKVGTGAFMKHEAAARKLAETMVGIGRSHGTPAVALLTDMNQPLGRQIGNANEIRESIDVLNGEGPDDLVEIVLALGCEMLKLGEAAPDDATARSMLRDTISSGSAMETFIKTVVAQGGDPSVIESPDLLPTARERWQLEASTSGYVTGCDALELGTAALRLGAGRAKKEDDIDPGVGIELAAKYGDEVTEGDVLATVCYNDHSAFETARPMVERAYSVGKSRPPDRPLVIGTVR